MNNKDLTVLQKLEKKREALDEQIKRKRQALREQERKNETRFKIILGGTIIAHMKHNPEFRTQVKKLLEKYSMKKDKPFLKKHARRFGFNALASKVSSSPEKKQTQLVK